MYVRFLGISSFVNEPFFSPTLSNPIGVFVDFYRTTPAGITFYLLRSFFLGQSSSFEHHTSMIPTCFSRSL